MIFAANGDRIELSYENGVVSGKATIKGRRYRFILLFVILKYV